MGLNTRPSVVVLGAKGLLGQTLFKLLKKHFLFNVHGTDRHDKNLLKFDAEDPHASFGRIQRKIGKIDFVINCIALLDPKTTELGEKETTQYIQVNTVFPHTIAQLAETHGFSFIHVSTDAVFDKSVTHANENTQPSPVGIYALTKLLGEPQSNNAITIRTSIIGKDQYKHRGIVEWVLGHKEKHIAGFVDQRWSGCTTPQFAELCIKIIEGNFFSVLRKKSAVFHFAPLGPVTKYTIVSLLAKKNTTAQKKYGGKITRTLKSKFAASQPFAQFYKKAPLEQTFSEMLNT